MKNHICFKQRYLFEPMKRIGIKILYRETEVLYAWIFEYK